MNHRFPRSGYFFALCGVSAVLFVFAREVYFGYPYYSFSEEVDLYKYILGIDPHTDGNSYLALYLDDRQPLLVVAGVLMFLALIFAAGAIWSYIADDE
ncbi:MAG: hypothetical protein ACREEK_00905 [Bradyrhizobium sp.]